MQLACCERVCVCVCLCVCVCVCVCDVVYQSNSPQPFVRGNDRKRVPDPNWASGTLHTPPVIVSTALLIIQTTREDKQRGEWCFCVCVCVQLLDVTSTSAYAWKLQMNIAGCLFVFVHVCVCVCVCDAVPIPLTSTFHARK